MKDRNIVVDKFVTDEVYYHSHEFIELVYFDSDHMVHRVEDKLYQVERGEIFLLNVGVPHNFYTTDKSNPEMVVYNCLFEPRALDAVLSSGEDFVELMYHRLFHNFAESEDYPNGFIRLQRSVDTDFKGLLKKMIAEREGAEPGWQYKMQAYLNLLLVDVLRAYKKQVAGEPLEDVQKNIVNKMVEYMSEHIGEDVHIQMMADTLFFSPSYLNRVFKSRMQISVLQYLQQLRMNAAGELLRTTDKSVARIAGEVGYSDLKHFYTLFKRHYGVSPRDFRERERRSVSEEAD